MAIRTRAAGWQLIGACILWLACASHALSAQTRQQFGEWTTVCSGASYCTASLRVRTSDGGQPYAFQLRVSRFQSRQGLEVAFLSARERPAAGEAIGVRIDGRDFGALTPEAGYRTVAGGGTYLITDRAASDRILAGMRTGKRVELSFRSMLGKPVVAAFSLAGFGRALGAIAGKEPLPTAAGTAAAGPSSAATQTGPARAGVGADAAPSGQASAATATGAPATAAPPPAGAPAPQAGAAAAPRPTSPTGAAPASPTAKTLPAPTIDQLQRNARAAERNTPPQPPPPGRRTVKAVTQFACQGNEPFWHLVVDGNTARYVRLSEQGEQQAVALTGKLRVTGEGRTPDVDWRGKAAGGQAYRAFIQEQRCLDSMSDTEGFNRFDYRVELTLPGGASAQGCCSAGLQLPQVNAEPDIDTVPMANLRSRPAGDWSRALLEWHPAIAACLARTPGNSPYVTKAWTMDKGLIGVRTRNSTVGWFECVAKLESAEVVRIGPVASTAAPVAGEERVVYTPTAQLPPAGNCYTHERVLDVEGNLLGWLSDNRC